MKTIEEHVDIQVPASDAYAQWTQFKEFPKIMTQVEAIDQIDDRHLRWQVDVGGRPVNWEAEITEQIPDKRIAWTSTGGTANAGCVTFHRLSDDSCRVMLQLAFEPHGVAEKTANLLGLVRNGVAKELENFRQFLEARDGPTGRWEGRIPAPGERGA